MIKVLHIDSWAGTGGGQSMLLNLLKHSSKDIESHIAAPAGDMLGVYTSVGAKTHVLENNNFLVTIYEVKKLIANVDPDVIHCHGTRAAVWGRIAKFVSRTPPKLVYTVHGFHMAHYGGIKQSVLLSLERFLNAHATDMIVAVSQHDKETMQKFHVVSKNNCVCIKNGIDVDVSLFKKKETNEILKLVTVARLHEPKDIESVIFAVKKLKESGIAVLLEIVGDGPDRQHLEKLVSENDLQNEVKFLGYRTDVLAIIARSDILVFSSAWEGLPLVPLEAGLVKTPVIGTDIPGIGEIITDGVDGLLFPYKNVNALVKKIVWLQDNPQKRSIITENAYTNVCKNFNATNMARAYEDLYKKLV